MNGLNPSWLADGADWLMPRCGSFAKPRFAEPIFDGPELAEPDGRVLLAFGGVNGRYPPRFPLCMVEVALPAFRLPGLLLLALLT